MYKVRLLLNSGLFNRNTFCQVNRYTIGKKLSFSTESEKVEENNAPIKYSQSTASKYKAKTSRTGIAEPRLWYEPYVLMVSISVFLLYFTVIREENDIDKELDRSLYSRIAGLEEHQLRLSLKYNEQHGLETDDIINRLKEIQEEKNEVRNS